MALSCRFALDIFTIAPQDCPHPEPDHLAHDPVRPLVLRHGLAWASRRQHGWCLSDEISVGGATPGTSFLPLVSVLQLASLKEILPACSSVPNTSAASEGSERECARDSAKLYKRGKERERESEPGRNRKFLDRRPYGAVKHMVWEALLETPEDSAGDGLGDIPVVDHMDDSEREERQYCKLERSNGGVGGGRAKTTGNGASPVVETTAQNRPPDCGIQRKPGRWYSMMALRLGRTRYANASLSAMCSSPSMSGTGMVEMEASPVNPGRQMDRSHPKRPNTFRWEEATANSFGKIGGGFAGDVNESPGWLGLAHDRQQWKAFIKIGGDGQRRKFDGGIVGSMAAADNMTTLALTSPKTHWVRDEEELNPALFFA